MKKDEEIDFVFPLSDVEILLFNRHRELFDRSGARFVVNAPYLIDTFMDKYRTVRFFEANDIAFPKTWRPEKYDNQLGFPLVLKKRVGRGGRGFAIAPDPDALAFYLKTDDDLIIQEFLPGVDNEYTAGIFSDGDINPSEFFKPGHMSDIYLSGMTDYVQDVIVGMLLRRIFNAKFRKEPWARPPLFIFVEEAHRFAAPPDEGGGRYSRDILARIAAEGAKFGVFLTVISQRPRRIDPDILANCSNLAILRIVNSQDQRTIQAASESFSEDLLADLPALEQGEAVLVGPFVPVPVMIKTATRRTKHGGTTPDIYGLLREARDRKEAEREKNSFKLH